MQIQQGDVLIQAKAIPDAAKPKKGRTVAHGEHTGHHHTFAPDCDVELYESGDGTLYCRVVSEQATLTHQEHGPVTLPRGDYEIGRVLEYDYEANEARHVAD
jgi:hypothetical protein